MKVMMRTILKVVPGKMAEYMEVEKKSKAMASRYGMPTWRRYNCLSGDSMHTLIYEMEWDSLAALEASFEKMFTDPERQAFMAKSDAVVESHVNEFYTPMP
jgi:antibiotic biosynthesis monooxygenase (ABM) superfamily enzyme